MARGAAAGRRTLITKRLLVVSPHLDDAVFSCGQALAAHPGSIVLTVFAGAPPEAARRSTEWDRRCGYADAAAALAGRCLEDEQAMALLGATARRLDFVDTQYGGGHDEAALVAALRAAIDANEEPLIVFPLGLFHADHEQVHRACVNALRDRPQPSVVYEDAIYRAMPGLVEQRWRDLAAVELRPARFALAQGSATAKAAAVAVYRSQLGAFSAAALDDLRQPERFWQLGPAR